MSHTRTMLHVSLMLICLIGTDRLFAAGDLTRREVAI